MVLAIFTISIIFAFRRKARTDDHLSHNMTMEEVWHCRNRPKGCQIIMAHHLEGRVDLTAIERSRLLGSLSAGSLGQLGSVTFSAADSSLSQLSASGSELPRSASPSTIQQYAGRFIPSSSIQPSGNSLLVNVKKNVGRKLPNSQGIFSTIYHIL